MELFLHHAPLVRLLIPFVLGILSALYFDDFSEYRFILLLPALFLLALLFFLKSRWRRLESNHFFGTLAAVLLFLLGGCLTYQSLSQDMNVPKAPNYLALIESTPTEKKNSFAVNIQVFKVQVDSINFQACNHRLIAYFSKEAAIEKLFPGQTILFSGHISKPPEPLYPSQFDYGKYLRNTGISGTVYLPAYAYSHVAYDYSTLKSTMNGIRKTLSDRVKQNSIPSREFGVISALLLGDRSMLDPELKTDFADAGAVHILAVSGLHVGIVYLLFLKILTFFFSKRARLLKFLLVLFVLWGYAALTGFSPSVLRAATMFSFIALGKHHKRYGNIYNMIAASAIVLLSITPLLITQIGFQMSYLAVIGIIFFHSKFYSLLIFDNRILDYCWSLLCVSFAAQLATFPLSIYYFHQFPTIFMLTNILVIPLASVILHVGVIWILVLWLPYVSDVLSWITVTSTWLLNESIAVINAIPFSKIDNLFLTSNGALIIYLIVILTTNFLLKPSKTTLRALGLAVIVLVAMHAQRRVSVALQDEIYFVNTTQEPMAIRLIQDRLFVYAQDSAEFSQSWKWELYPYFLTRGVDRDGVLLTRLDGESPLLCVTSLDSVRTSVFIAWNPRKKAVRLKSKTKQADLLLASSTGLTRLETKELTRFSSDPLPQPR